MTKEKKEINFNKTGIQEGILLQRGVRKKQKKKTNFFPFQQSVCVGSDAHLYEVFLL